MWFSFLLLTYILIVIIKYEFSKIISKHKFSIFFLSLERANDVNAIVREIKKKELLLNPRLFAATMRKQLQMENLVPRSKNQCVVLMGKLTTISVNSAKQLCKHTEAHAGIAPLVWVNGV